MSPKNYEKLETRPVNLNKSVLIQKQLKYENKNLLNKKKHFS